MVMEQNLPTVVWYEKTLIDYYMESIMFAKPNNTANRTMKVLITLKLRNIYVHFIF